LIDWVQKTPNIATLIRDTALFGKEFANHIHTKNDLKHEINFGKEFASEGVEAAYTARTIVLIYSYLKSFV